RHAARARSTRRRRFARRFAADLAAAWGSGYPTHPPPNHDRRAPAGFASPGSGKSGAMAKPSAGTKFGYTLSSEEHAPQQLVRLAADAAPRGFDFVSISDHYPPWVGEQGHAAFVWSVLGGVAASTSTIEVGVGMTCPIMRIHPAVLAQAAATTACLFGD